MFNADVLRPVYRWLSKGRSPSAANPPRPRTMVHGLALRLDATEAIQNAMAAGVYEPEQTAWARECLSPGDRFVDVGANFGWYTALAATLVGPQGRVIAFEPSPVAAAVIADMIAENELANVELVRSAVGEASGSIHLHMPVGDLVHSPSAFVSDPTFTPLEVAVTALDQYEPLWDGRAIKLIKIDVEGYEPNVLYGMAGLAQQGLVENLFLEFNSGWLKRNGTTPAALFDLVRSYGFETERATSLATHRERNGDPFELQDMWLTWRG